MQLDQYPELPLPQRNYLAAIQVGRKLDAIRPPPTGGKPQASSEGQSIFVWLTEQDDAALALAALGVCAETITNRTRGADLIAAANSVYNDCKAIEATLTPPAKESGQMDLAKRRQSGRAARKATSTDNPAA